jgi:hypothetical protein
MEIPITRPFFVIPPLSRNTAEQSLVAHPDRISHLPHPELAYDM